MSDRGQVLPERSGRHRGGETLHNAPTGHRICTSSPMRERRCAMLNSATVKPMIPVKDMRVAGKFYEEKLGLRKVDGSPDTALVYESGDSTLCVYRSEF